MTDSIDTLTEQPDDLFVEACQEINEIEAIAPRAAFDGLLKDAPQGSTSIANGLSQQLIHQINLLKPNALVSFDDLDVELGEAAYPFVPPEGKQALQRAIADRKKTLVVNSAYRTLAQQMLLYNWRGSNSNPVAPPGKSNHQSGLAIDLEDPRGWEPYLMRYGWNPLSGDPPHFNFQGGGAIDIRSKSILAFQQLWNKNNPGDRISEDGSFGPQTARALNQSPAIGFAKAPWDDQPRILKLTTPRLEGSDVERLQTALKQAGITVAVDGEFGPGTDQAVKEFQQQKSLTSDGIVGATTLAAL